MKEITVEQLHNLPPDSYELIDIRDDGLVEYGMIPGAIHIDLEELEKGRNSKIEAIAKDKVLILYCEIGRRSREIEDLRCFEGRECLSLEGGYVGYIRSGLKIDSDNGMTQKKAEESIQKLFHKRLFSPFAKACKTYQLISEGDHIAVCIPSRTLHLPWLR